MVPSQLLSLCLACLLYLLPVHASAQMKDSLLTQLARKWSNSRMYTLKIAELRPEEFYNFKAGTVDLGR